MKKVNPDPDKDTMKKAVPDLRVINHRSFEIRENCFVLCCRVLDMLAGSWSSLQAELLEMVHCVGRAGSPALQPAQPPTVRSLEVSAPLKHLSCSQHNARLCFSHLLH